MYNVLEHLGRIGDIMNTYKFYEDDLDNIVNCLKNDGVLAVNTDTVMGLCIVSDSESAFDKLMHAKDRPPNKLFPVMVSDVEMMESIAHVNDRDRIIIHNFLPGQLTIILNKKEDASLLLDSDTVAIRIVDDVFLMKLVQQLNKPIFLTSANKSGESTSQTAAEVLSIFDGLIEGVLMKDANGYEASTIVDLTGDEIKVVRAGNISEKQIKESLEE